ncbi:MAG: carbohydrate-binding domain-containing protein [Bacilli bacterium]|nr:carbohydrate-binding domain-containing protein [Bacilli bacterium]
MKSKLLLALASSALLVACGSGSGTAYTSGSTAANSASGQTSAVSVSEDSVTSEFSLVDESGNAISASSGVYSITAAGTYTASGKLSGQIYVNAADAEVELDLDGVSISNSSVSPIFVETCADFDLKVKSGTTNYIYDNRTTDYSETTDESVGTAAIYVADGDLKIKGTGTLSIVSLANSGIHGKDNVTVKNVTMLVKAVNNGIKGNDKVTVEENPTLGIVAGNNGIRTSNSEVGTNAQHGYVYINGGAITINSYGDGIDAAYAVEFGTSTDDDGNTCAPTVDIYTNIYSSYSYSAVTSSSRKSAYAGPGGNQGGGNQDGGNQGGGGFDGGGMTGGSSAEKADESAKAIKAPEAINIAAGDIFCYTYDDCIHTNGDDTLDSGATPSAQINVTGGTLNLKASDDALHADGTLTISGGTINVAESHEGVEANTLNIKGGETTVYASDDGLNASSQLNISGGRVDVNMSASGDVDGIDSNGSITISGGTVITRGPASDMSGAIDADGNVSIKGGAVVIIGYCPTISSSLTKTTTSSGLSSGSHTVTFGSTSFSYSNAYTYSGSAYVFASSTATIS